LQNGSVVMRSGLGPLWERPRALGLCALVTWRRTQRSCRMSGRPEDARSRHRAPDRGECENGVERQKEHGNAGEIVVRVYRSDRQGHPSNYNESRRYYCYPNHGWSLCRFASTLASRVLDQTLSVRRVRGPVSCAFRSMFSRSEGASTLAPG
jgi:hypothetical protein